MTESHFENQMMARDSGNYDSRPARQSIRQRRDHVDTDDGNLRNDIIVIDDQDPLSAVIHSDSTASSREHGVGPVEPRRHSIFFCSFSADLRVCS
jgi:hypothetical protein